MNNRERLKEIIIQLKQIKYDRELSTQDIHDMVIEAGLSTSITSVRRVFSEGSENQNFRYQDTIQPIAQVLIGVNEEAEPLNATEADALKQIALLKDSMITDLQREIEAERRTHEDLQRELDSLQKAYEDCRVKIDFLKDQVKVKDEQIHLLTVQLGRKDRLIDQFNAQMGRSGGEN